MTETQISQIMLRFLNKVKASILLIHGNSIQTSFTVFVTLTDLYKSKAVNKDLKSRDPRSLTLTNVWLMSYTCIVIMSYTKYTEREILSDIHHHIVINGHCQKYLLICQNVTNK